ncbi:glycoside hydrolase [Meredithblackwellia eburnea MCA 4105]
MKKRDPSPQPAAAGPTTAPTIEKRTTCAAKYAPGGTTITGTGTLPKPTTFVSKSGQGLVLDGKSYRIAGPNMYWLCNDENVAPVDYYTDKGRVREALAIAVAMGANTVRLTSCGTSTGSQYSIEPTRASFAAATAAQWDIHDYVIYAAGQYGLRVIMPLTDDYDFYYGSKYTFLRWNSVSTGNWGNAFYTNAAVIYDFQSYIKALLSRVNKYNNIAYRNDPTILGWETGNELGAYIGKEGYPPADWTAKIAQQLKTLAPKQLVIDGTDGIYNYSTKATAPGLTVANVDIVSDHAYPRNIALLNSEIPLATQANKGFLIGEFDWTNSFGGDTLDAFLAKIESTSYMGSMMWSIQGHDAQCCAFVTHTDGYEFYYPNGSSADKQANMLKVIQHFYRLTGRTPPTKIPAVACPQIVF